MTNKAKGSTILTLQGEKKNLEEFARGLYELYDIDRDGEDWFTAYQMSDGSFADINIYAYENEPFDVRTITITAYAVDELGQMIPEQSLLLLSKRIANNTNYMEGM